MAKFSNRFWFQLHGWFSLPIWVFVSFVCLTGTLSVISHEMTWLANPDARATNPNHVQAHSPADSVNLVEAAYPTADVTGVVTRESYLVHEVMFTDKDKPYALAYVNPYTGAIQEVNDGNTFITFMRSLHGWLFMPWQEGYSIGYYLVSAMGMVLLGALVTGLIVYKKFWKGFFKPNVRRQQAPRSLTANLHKFAGVWSLWFLLIMGVTGLWYLFQGVLWHNEVEIEPWPAPLEASALPNQLNHIPNNPVSLADSLEIARRLYPDFTTSYLALPEHNRDTYKLSGHGDFLFFDDYSYNVAVNPWDGSIEQQFSPATMGGLQTLMHIADPLHYGTIGGLWTKMIWFVFGLVITAMCISGFIMWFLRVNKATKKHHRTVLSSNSAKGAI